MPDRPDLNALEDALLSHPRLRMQTRTFSLPAGTSVIRQGQACADIFVLRAGLVAGSAALVPVSTVVDARPSAAAVTPVANPFTLGVASGDPAPDASRNATRPSRMT